MVILSYKKYRKYILEIRAAVVWFESELLVAMHISTCLRVAMRLRPFKFVGYQADTSNINIYTSINNNYQIIHLSLDNNHVFEALKSSKQNFTVCNTPYKYYYNKNSHETRKII